MPQTQRSKLPKKQTTAPLVELGAPVRHLPLLFDAFHPLPIQRALRQCLYTETLYLLFVKCSINPRERTRLTNTRF